MIMAKHVINNPGGRKRLSEDEKYGEAIAVRYTKKQKIRLLRKAGDKPVSTYIRESSLHAIVRQPVTKEFMKEIRDLNNLGTNVNAIAKHAHQAGIESVAKEAEEALDGINSVLRQARLKIKKKEEEDTSLLVG